MVKGKDQPHEKICRACQWAGGYTLYYHSLMAIVAVGNFLLTFTGKKLPAIYFILTTIFYVVWAVLAAGAWALVCGGTLADELKKVSVSPWSLVTCHKTCCISVL